MNMDVTGLTGGLFRGLLSRIYPPRCVLCNADGVGDRDLCARCDRGLPWLGSACVQCALPLSGAGDGDLRCGRCLNAPPAFDRSLSLFSYQDDVIRLIHQLKFNQKLAYSRLLGDRLAEAVEQRFSSRPDCILPVPLHRSRLRQRGYNQSIELARPVARALKVSLDVRSVVRVRNTNAQTGLDRTQRRKNIRGAFALAREIGVKHVAIVDDVDFNDVQRSDPIVDLALAAGDDRTVNE